MSSPVLKRAKLSSNVGASLYWFRNDLRLHDNTALSHCLSVSATSGTPVFALFIISREEWQNHGIAPVKVDLILRSIRILRQDLKDKLGIPLIVVPIEGDENPNSSGGKRSFIGRVANAVSSICQTWNVQSLFANKEYEVDELQRDELVGNLLMEKEITATFIDDQCIVEPGKVLTKEGRPYTVFTPFKNCWLNVISNDSKRYMVPKSLPDKKQSWPEDAINGKTLGEIPVEIKPYFKLPDNIEAIRKLWPAGESAGRERLEAFCQGPRVKGYNESRNIPSNEQGTSRLSPYLSLGLISARECMSKARDTSKSSAGVDVWVSELCWRDFYRHVLFHFPRVCKNRPFKEEFSKVKWRDDEKGFEAWKAGKTGFPIVDAAMRELLQTGYMHNRCRMITAMFLTKDLLIDWRKGEEYFMKHLIDGDFASNNGGWQWSASTGTDAQPYFRIFNPLLQSEKVDPEGTYIRRYLPELSDLKDKKRIHQPTLSDCQKYSYPKPIVNHDEARKRAIAAFKSIKEESS